MLLNPLNATRGMFRPVRFVRPSLARIPHMRPLPGRFYSAELDPKTYHQLSDDALENMLVSYEDLAEFVPEIDIELAVCIYKVGLFVCVEVLTVVARSFDFDSAA